MSSFKFEAWPTEYRSINQYFGANPQNYQQFGLPGHDGLDIMAPSGSKVFAVAPGKVVQVYPNATGHNYGIHVRIDHVDEYQTTYAHLQRPLVQVGQTVSAGDLIALANDTGNSFGSHLHLTLKKKGAQEGNWPYNIIDPTPFILTLMGWQRPAGPYTAGWAYTDGLFAQETLNLAQVNSGGINLREQPSVRAKVIDLVPAETIVIITGRRRGLYTPVQAPTSALSSGTPTPTPPPDLPPPSTVVTVDGWGWRNYLTVSGSQAVVGQYGINLRQKPNRSGQNIGLVQGGSTVTVLGAASGNYLPVRVRRQDFMGPVNLPEKPPQITPGDPTPPADSYLGWAWTPYLTVTGAEALVGRFGINLRDRPSRSGQNIGLLKGGATATVVGQAVGEYTPVAARKTDVLNAASPMPAIQQPTPLTPTDATPPTPPAPVQDTTPGWAFSAQITMRGNTAVAGPYGINLRDAPRRNGTNIGFIPANTEMIVTGAAQGEYTPIRVDDDDLQQPFGTAPATQPTTPPATTFTPAPPVNPDPPPMGQAKIGLHASADPFITDQEIGEFKTMRPGMIKLLSHHNMDQVRKLAAQHPDVSWVVRAFLDFGGRNVTPQQFFQWTVDSVEQMLGVLNTEDVAVELHNEPNLTPEGLSASWRDGAAFARWWLELLDLYRKRLPGRKFIYPGLSPGSTVTGLKQDHIQFIEASRAAVEAADGLGVHIYWSKFYPMTTSLGVLDDYISRFRFKPIWVTEASNNKEGSPAMKGRQYLTFWQELQKRATVQGVTYFVASSINPTFAEEVWVGRGIARIVGRR